MKRKHIIFIHILFWSVIFTATGLETIPSFGKYSMNIIAGDYFIYTASYVSMFYMFYFFISNRHLAERKITYLVLTGILSTFVLSLPVTFIYIYFISEKLFELSRDKFLLAFGRHYFRFLEMNFIFVITGSLLKIALLWYSNIIKQKEAEKQFIAGELALLRSQINPRFLFNTLTYIKTLVETKQDKAIYSIENLSELMSYMLYETSAEKIPLDNEINYVNTYLNIQKVKYYPDYIRFEVTGETGGVMIPPLLFMPFLEYAFKNENNISPAPGIIIRLENEGSSLSFEVINSKNKVNDYTGQENNPDIIKLKRWLDMQLGKNYKLDIKNDNNKNYIKLGINLIK